MTTLTNSLGELTATIESSSGNSYIVDLENHSCTCGVWKDTQIPCSHAISLIGKIPTITVLSFLPSIFKTDSIKKFYSMLIPSVNFDALKQGTCTAPPISRKRGRPATLRIPSAHEGGRRKQSKCNRCGERGHNIRSCPLMQYFE